MTKLNDLLDLPFPLVLASQSPRRKNLLRQIGFDFNIVIPDVDESGP
jgi:septum formation protein